MYSMAGSSKEGTSSLISSLVSSHRIESHIETKSLLSKVTVCVASDLGPEILLVSACSGVMDDLI
jgi:hypothetical protein